MGQKHSKKYSLKNGGTNRHSTEINDEVAFPPTASTNGRTASDEPVAVCISTEKNDYIQNAATEMAKVWTDNAVVSADNNEENKEKLEEKNENKLEEPILEKIPKNEEEQKIQNLKEDDPKIEISIEKNKNSEPKEEQKTDGDVDLLENNKIEESETKQKENLKEENICELIENKKEDKEEVINNSVNNQEFCQTSKEEEVEEDEKEPVKENGEIEIIKENNFEGGEKEEEKEELNKLSRHLELVEDVLTNNNHTIPTDNLEQSIVCNTGKPSEI
uniref:Uncharacterized protein n=1 Tax=Meloidogyne enterolobii TaxID=390850 RepID=A0A6V7V2S4_MELEN|nr:unnamed protein product [Meloidogyne enterolobii]